MKQKLSLCLGVLFAFTACEDETENGSQSHGEQPLEITGKVWRITEKTTGESDKQTFPATYTDDFDGDGSPETIAQEEFYVFDSSWCYKAYRYEVLEDNGSDQSSLLEREGNLYADIGTPVSIEDDSILFYIHKYMYRGEGDALTLSNAENTLVFEYTSSIGKEDVIAALTESDPDDQAALLTNKVWRIKEKTTSKDGTNIYPVTITDDFDGDGTNEVILRENFCFFEEGWAYHAYRYTIITDEGDDTETLKQREGNFYTALGTAYLLKDNSLWVYGKNYAYENAGSTMTISDGKDSTIFEHDSQISGEAIKEAPLEPENGPDPQISLLTNKVWRIKQEIGLSKGDRFFPLTTTGDFDNDGTEETLKREDFYLFDGTKWCYKSYRFSIVEDEGTDKETLRQREGVFYVGADSYYTLKNDSIVIYGNGYQYQNDGTTLLLIREGYTATLEHDAEIKISEIMNSESYPAN